MARLLFALWDDDAGALLTTEFLFLATILVIGLVVGLTTLRNAIATELTELANAILQLINPGSDPLPAPKPTDPVSSPINVDPC
jgi:Flp pilus assembly pilin Flp